MTENKAAGKFGDLPAYHHAPAHAGKGFTTQEAIAMTNQQYRAALKLLGLNIAGSAPLVLGISKATSQRYAGTGSIPGPVAKLLLLMIERNIAPSRVETLQ